MLTIRRSGFLSQKNDAETDENSPRRQPSSSHSQHGGEEGTLQIRPIGQPARFEDGAVHAPHDIPARLARGLERIVKGAAADHADHPTRAAESRSSQ